jgi:hypothetical protein
VTLLENDETSESRLECSLPEETFLASNFSAAAFDSATAAAALAAAAFFFFVEFEGVFS